MTSSPTRPQATGASSSAGDTARRLPPRTIPPFAEFRPHRLLRSGHLQTIVGAYIRSSGLPYRAVPHVVDLPDGEQLVLHDDCPEDWQTGDRCVLLLHGLGGCHRSHYMVRMADKLNARGLRVFRMDMRGHGAGMRLAGSPGHAGRSEDVRAVVDWISAHCPGSPLGLAGISLGGNVILKYLGECGAAVPRQVERALTVAPPIDLVECSRLIRRWRSRLYDRAFVKELMQQLEERRPHWPAIAALDLPSRPRTLWQFDDLVTAPLSGFRDARHYYTEASAVSRLAVVAVPTVILTAADDPLVPPHIFERAVLSPHISLRVTRHGGHVGYLGAGGVDPDRHWLDWRVVDWAVSPLTPPSV